MQERIIKELETSATLLQAAARDSAEHIAAAVEVIVAAYRSGHKLLLAGNGGSAADAQHLATELAGRFLKERRALAAVALTTNTSLLTAVANDSGFENVFSRQIEALGNPGDVFIGITTSGASPNVLRALEVARRQGLKTVLLTGDKGGSITGKADVIIGVPSPETPRVQETHIAIGHLLCRLVEEGLFHE